ncbi:alpha/beta-hydrolase [Trametes versicolor FP-101664 SS1]|uniref:alpha/beta-hydrolase n=1 Tax=Trametes versicolor (strain FP-101664) TaxID=717944 RepID=UPI0004624495|nr:alpha/beta-hydrolase [Trametes versicolor FP-101664 SS1]EIW57676.1 alpha/beta-hydrolase [Trametes versicolor FP-101664 SS1]
MSSEDGHGRSTARTTRRDTVDLPSGTTLEYVLLQPTSANGPKKLAVCLHPWSWLGGRMDDPVLKIMTEPLLEQGYDVLRYNSRGVGKSKGWASLTGAQEVEDLKDLVKWVLSNSPELSKLVIVGYSHGSLIASMHPVLPDLDTSHILLSYPLGPRHWLTAFHTHWYTTALRDLVRDPKSNVLVIYSDGDNFTAVESYDAWAQGLKDLHVAEAQDVAEAHGKLEVVEIAGASHFWREPPAVRRLLDVVRTWVQ